MVYYPLQKHSYQISTPVDKTLNIGRCYKSGDLELTENRVSQETYPKITFSS